MADFCLMNRFNKLILIVMFILGIGVLSINGVYAVPDCSSFCSGTCEQTGIGICNSVVSCSWNGSVCERTGGCYAACDVLNGWISGSSCPPGKIIMASTTVSCHYPGNLPCYNSANCVKCGDPPNLPPLCYENGDCDDGNICTNDVCNSPGTSNASCSHSNHPVNGGWSWGTCSNYTQTGTCDNPAPSCGGAACVGSNTQACGTPPTATPIPEPPTATPIPGLPTVTPIPEPTILIPEPTTPPTGGLCCDIDRHCGKVWTNATSYPCVDSGWCYYVNSCNDNNPCTVDTCSPYQWWEQVTCPPGGCTGGHWHWDVTCSYSSVSPIISDWSPSPSCGQRQTRTCINPSPGCSTVCSGVILSQTAGSGDAGTPGKTTITSPNGTSLSPTIYNNYNNVEPALSWSRTSPTSFTDYFEVQIRDLNTGTVLNRVATGTSIVVDFLAGSRNYQWRVRAVNNSCTSITTTYYGAWSDYGYFYLNENPYLISLVLKNSSDVTVAAESGKNQICQSQFLDDRTVVFKS
jgi:hypothetical protein